MSEDIPKSASIRAHFYPESAVSGFSHVDMAIGFYSQIAAILRPEHHVLDFGAGRGEPITDDPVPFRRNLVNLQGRCAHLTGCDVDPVVMTNPYLDAAVVIVPDEKLPFPDASFDIIVSRYVFEHLPDPAGSVAEMLRVLKPGGWICATTPNRFGYVALAASLIPNRLHVAYLKKIQPERKAEDVFPTVYGLNSLRALRRHFGPHGELHVFRHSSEPAYHFNSRFLFGALKLFHKILPDVFQTALFIYFRKTS